MSCDSDGLATLLCCGQRAEITVPVPAPGGGYFEATYETTFVNVTHTMNSPAAGGWYHLGRPNSFQDGRSSVGFTTPPMGATARVHFRRVYEGYNWNGEWAVAGLFGNWSLDDPIFVQNGVVRADLIAHYQLNSGQVMSGPMQLRQAPEDPAGFGRSRWENIIVDCCCSCLECRGEGNEGTHPTCPGCGTEDPCGCGCFPVCLPRCYPDGCPDNECNPGGNPDCNCGTLLESAIVDEWETDKGIVSISRVTDYLMDVRPEDITNPRHPSWDFTNPKGTRDSESWRDWHAYNQTTGSYATCPDAGNGPGYTNAFMVEIAYRSDAPLRRSRGVGPYAYTRTIHSSCLDAFDSDHPCSRVCPVDSVFASADYGVPYNLRNKCITDFGCLGIDDACNNPNFSGAQCLCSCNCWEMWQPTRDSTRGVGYSEADVCGTQDCANANYVQCGFHSYYGSVPPLNGTMA
tara:strand:+ start:9520 stop:10899 length:1380 start_codon:yes stop_codon:yes gene_type:complete